MTVCSCCRRDTLWLACVALPVLLAGCADGPGAGPLPERPFRLQHLAKTDIDTVMDTHIRLSMDLLRELMGKLYRRNPVQLQRGRSGRGIDAMREWTFAADRPALLAELGNRTSTAALQLAFDPDFDGDRVLAFVEGLRSMLLRAYAGKQDFYLLDQLDPQKLHDAARNIEIAVWKLGHDRDPVGGLLLLSNAFEGPVPNISYERLFGKLIALQDSLALVIADAANRRIKNAVQNIATAVFVPI